ncbi:integrase [Cyanobium sp.]|nr:integrase [Cyanobium sp.]
MKLTKTAVDRALPRPRRYRLNDSLVPGLCLLVLPSGARTYYLRHRVDGAQRELKLGTPAELSPDQARELAREALARVRAGGDPGAERRAARVAPTIEALAARHLQAHASRKRSGRNDEILWRRHLLPAFARVRVATLTREQVREWHVCHPQPATANRALEVLGVAMGLAEEWGWRPAGSNPARGVKAHPERQRRRYASQEELARLRAAMHRWEEAGPLAVRWRFIQLVRLLLLTGARLREVMNAQWSEIDWQRGVLRVPLERGKTGAAEVRLSERAVAVLRDLLEAQGVAGGGAPWVIPGETGERPLVGYRKLWLALLADAGIVGLRVHDLRHTFASYSLSGGQTLGTVGQLLGHRSTQTTSRYAHLVDDAARAAVERVSDDLGM